MYPAIMRFTTVDPLAEDYYDVSPYAYVLNNPLRYTDPTGMSSENANDKEDIDGGELTEVTVVASKYDPIGTRAMDAVEGFWEWAEYIAYGRTYQSNVQNTLINVWRVDHNGIIVGAQPLTGTVDVSPVGKVGTYLKLRSYLKVIRAKGFEVHHLTEVRHLRHLFKSKGKAPSVILTKSQHQALTNELRQLLTYNTTYTKSQIVDAYKKAYSKHPEWLKLAIDYLLE